MRITKGLYHGCFDLRLRSAGVRVSSDGRLIILALGLPFVLSSIAKTGVNMLIGVDGVVAKLRVVVCRIERDF